MIFTLLTYSCVWKVKWNKKYKNNPPHLHPPLDSTEEWVTWLFQVTFLLSSKVTNSAVTAGWPGLGVCFSGSCAWRGGGPVKVSGFQDWLEIGLSYLLWALLWDFLDSSAGKESACNVGDPGSIPGSGRSAGEGIGYPLQYLWASLVAQLVKNLPAMQKTWVWSLGGEDPLEKGRLTTPVFWPGEYSPWGWKELDMTKWLSLSLWAFLLLPLCQELGKNGSDQEKDMSLKFQVI